VVAVAVDVEAGVEAEEEASAVGHLAAEAVRLGADFQAEVARAHRMVVAVK
jgi:hypothetical protein